MKRFTAFLLTLTLLFTLVAVPVSAQENTGPTVQVSSVTAKAGESNVAVEIFLKNNPGIAGFSFCVDYDADNLVLVKSEVNITGGYQVATPVNDHQVNIAWAGSGTYSANEKIATLYFNIPKNAAIGKHDLKISYRDGYDSFYQYSGGTEQDIPATAVNGYVQIEDAIPTTMLTVSAGTATASMSDTDVTVPITVANNDGLSGFSFCIDYDESRLEFKSAEIKIDGGYKVINHPEGYAVCIAWTDENQYVQNTSIAELHFSVKSNAKSGKAFVNILFRNGYDSFYKTVNKQEVDIECAVENGYVNIMDHNFGEWKIVKESTCTETGLKRRSCTDAGCTVVDELVIPKIAHNYVHIVAEATCSSEGYTTHKCSSCGASYVDTYVEKKAHTVGEWETTVQPGCTTPGTKVKKCSVCKESIETEEIKANGHVYGEWETFKEATFSEDGENRKYCGNCDYYQSKRIPKLSESHIHSYTGKEEVVENPTCTEPGSKRIYCSETECGSYITETIKATGHSFGEWQITTAATFDTDGVKTRYCQNCPAFETERIPKLSEGHTHDYTGKEEIIKSPTCTESGSKKVYCLEPSCGEYITVTINPTGHTPGEWKTTVEAKCTTPGTKVKKCTVCHEVVETQTIPATGHTLGEWEVTVEPKCTTSGAKVRKCTVCHEVVETQTIVATGHTPGEWETETPATCTSSGTKVKKCTVCKEVVERQTVPSTGHTPGEWEIEKPATCTSSGTKIKKCTVCKEIIERQTIPMTDHEYEDTIVPATPDVQGYTLHQCKHCSHSYKDNFVEYVEESTGQITVDTKKACAGKNVLVNVVMENNPGIWGMDLAVNYDKTKLTLNSVTNGIVFSDSEWTKGNLSGEKYILSYEAAGFENVTENGTVATLEFTVNNDANVNDFYEISVSYKPGDIIDVDFNEPNISIVSGGIQVIKCIFGDLNDDGLVNKKDSLLMKMYLADNTTVINQEAADVFADGSINKKDSLLLKQFLAGLDVELGA